MSHHSQQSSVASHRILAVSVNRRVGPPRYRRAMHVISVFVLFLAYSLCRVTVNAFLFPDCQNGPLASSTICDESASVEMRARDLVSKLSAPERISRLSSTSVAIPRLGIPSYEWSNDALHGLRPGPGIIFASGDVPFNSSTAFPSPINFGATWSDENGRIAANIIGTEARAFANNNRAGLDLWAPNINPFRDPRWSECGQCSPARRHRNVLTNILCACVLV